MSSNNFQSEVTINQEKSIENSTEHGRHLNERQTDSERRKPILLSELVQANEANYGSMKRTEECEKEFYEMKLFQVSLSDN